MKTNNSIFQIYIQDDDYAAIPSGISDCIKTIITGKEDYDHYIIGGEALREIIRKNIGIEAVNAYDKLKPYAYRADFGRYCLLYLYGGWYFDASIRLNAPLSRYNSCELIVFKDAPNPGLPSWDLSNSVIYGKQSAPIFENMIIEIIKNTQNEYYGVSPLSPTGPTLFGRTLANLGEQQSTITGMLMPLTPLHALKNNAFIMPDGVILAWGKSSWGTSLGDGLEAFGTNGTNSYNKMYRNKDIYN